MTPTPDRFDVAVIGAGFGGLGAALTLAEAGQRVVLLEALSYPGGCASTFSRRGHRFEAGATLFAGLGEGQLLRRWRDAYAPGLALHFPDPVIELRAPGLTLAIPPRREALVEALLALPGAPEAGLRAFFAEQGRAADALWPLFDDPERLPPFGEGGLAANLRALPRLLPLARLPGRPLAAVARRHGVAGFEPLRWLLDATCQITVQAPSAKADALIAMGALDYTSRGAGHVEGGIGALAGALAGAVEALGGELRLASRVRGLQRAGGRWRLETRGGAVEADAVMANLLPQDLSRLAGQPLAPDLARAVAGGWGAAMLYLGLGEGAADRQEAHHIEIIDDPSRPFIEGNHLFVSVSAAGEPGRAPPGGRTATVSTHLPMDRLRGLDDEARGDYVQSIQERMRAVLGRTLPQLRRAVVLDMPASPRTFARFTRRHEGLVGGVPRVAGLRHLLDLGPRPVAEGLYLVGDSVFPGQSALAAAIGGRKAAQHLLARRPPRRRLLEAA